jgi:pimeloyl-ACP methyl ester carboxylesterase
MTSVSVPDWFTRALADVPEQRSIEVLGARVSYRTWGTPGAPGVVLVHGGSAHAGWWDHVAPQLTGYRVVAPDLSGHGDSDHREDYDVRVWAREVVEVAAAEDLGRPVVVGHSRGGWVAVTAGVEHSGEVGGVVLVDSPLWPRTPDPDLLRRRRAARRVHPTRGAALERFVPLPEQDVVLPFVREHISGQSVRAVDGGWSWKFDPRSFGRPIPQEELLARLVVPTAVLHCEHGLVSDVMAQRIAGMLPERPPVVRLAGSGHHPMLDQPLPLVATLQTLLAVWTTAASRA